MTKANPVEIQKYLKGFDYPAEKSDLIKHAKQHGADQDVISILEQLPENQKYQTPTDLNKAIGKII
ncbi:DUF2795 domain-containing protein [Nodularia sp. UHCC 0506]|uniref:DUF2795 domain-containing protein n=1 Tax=Nodularia sp. UHCC 0506 TaxID=3110243 RepID=UPI002B207FE0|nr:DUF2795 domain-containing protein [Nodularia sp. UHCC 0506]MEA5514518.1 DUF2795 domain-containing protein [Nodularia sp. UHCC 0506]